MTTLRHDDEMATNRYRCPDCRKRWANDNPRDFQDACPGCHATAWPLHHGMTARQRFTAYWILVFVAGWGFGAATGYALATDTWWQPLW